MKKEGSHLSKGLEKHKSNFAPEFRGGNSKGAWHVVFGGNDEKGLEQER